MSMKKIAGVAGVSVSTVSLVLSGKGRISESVKEKVLAAARDLNYKSPLYEVKSNTVAVLYSIDREWSHVLEFMNGILLGLDEKLVENGFTPILVPIHFGDSIDILEKKIRDVTPKAVCTIHYIDEKLFSALEERGIPVVVINSSLLQGRFTTVCVDDFQGAYEGGRYLLDEVGDTNICFVGYAKGNMTGQIDDRVYGFQKALLEAGVVDVREKTYYAEEPVCDGVRYVIADILAAARPPAIFAYDDYLAVYVIAELERAGLGVPDDVRMLAPGDTINYDLPCAPQVSTMSIDTYSLGVYGAELVLGRVDSVETVQSVRKIRQVLTIRKT